MLSLASGGIILNTSNAIWRQTQSEKSVGFRRKHLKLLLSWGPRGPSGSVRKHAELELQGLTVSRPATLVEHVDHCLPISL